MNKERSQPSYLDCVVQTLSQSREPITLDTLVACVEAQRPNTRGARTAIFRALEQLYQAVPVTPNRYGWLSSLMFESMFRHPMTNEESKRGHLLLDELEHAVFFPNFFQNHKPDDRTLTIELFGGTTIQAWTEVERKIWSLRLGEDFTEWVEEQGGMGKDDLLISVLDAQNGRYGLRLQPRESRITEEIAERNLQLAKLANEIVRDEESGTLSIWSLAARIVGRGFYRHPVPPDELHFVLQKQSDLIENDQGILIYLPGRREMGEMALGSELTNERGRPRRDLQSRDRQDDVFEYGDPDNEIWAEAAELDEKISAVNWDRDDDACEAYTAYLEGHSSARRKDRPLAHDDFHLLEAELETLVNLEQEFGYLMPEQIRRKEDLADRLFIDPETLLDPGWDDPDSMDYDGPPFWNN